MFATRIFAVSLLLLNSVQSLPVTVELETVVMQLRSKENSNNDELLSEMLDYTARYMDDYFGAYYVNSQPANYFSYTGLDINSYGIHGVTGSFITTLEIDGVLVFNSEPAPSQAFIRQLLDNAFQGLNFQLFVEGLQSSDSKFLNELTHVIIDIGGALIAEEDLEDTTAGEGNGGEDSGSSWNLNDWSEIAIYATAGVIGALLIMGLFWIIKFCCSKRNRQVEDDLEPVKLKSIEIPTSANREQPRKQFWSERSFSHNNMKKSTDIIYSPNDTTLSPVRSITSQDSSKFTYNPGMSVLSKTSFSIGSLSNFDLHSVDLEAWQRNDAISSVAAPFGHDISAIEKRERDLSLIEEGDEEEPKSFEKKRAKASSRARSESESRNPRSSKQHSRSSSYQQSKPASKTNRVIEYSNEESAMGSDASSDVINDLRNLSRQIESHRRSKSRR